ncbi:MAG: TonB-dependent receptor [Steroidobacteraceae bacterium]
MTVNQAIRHSVKQALASSALVALATGGLAAHAQQAATLPAAASRQAATTQHAAASTKAAAAKKAAALRLASASPQSVQPATASTASPTQTLQTIVVTGSLISQTSVVTPSPVQIVDMKQIVQSGYTDISDVLRNISANGASTLTQSFSFAFASGGAGISLRGLSVGDTLVLVDGERTVPYPLLDDNERNFVDLSSIPFTAIQQVQVLKDGGSALYGSDAIAGVVNVILRKEYQGLNVTAEGGTSSHWDGTTEHFGFIGGHGDLAADGYNWYISGDFRHQDQILASNRQGLWDTLNFAPWGGYDTIPGHIDPNFEYPVPADGYLLNPNNPTSLQSAAFLPGCSYVQLTLDQCSSLPAGAQLRPAGTNTDILGKFTKEIGGDWELGLQASWFDSVSQQRSQYVNQLANAWNDTGGSISTVAFGPYSPPEVITSPPITVPADYPGNPFGTPAPLIYQFPELGEGITSVDTNTYRLLASLTGKAAGWDIKGTVGAMEAVTQQSQADLVEPAALQTALNNGYTLGSAGATQLFSPVQKWRPTSDMDLLDVHGTHKLFTMPGGPLSLALGVQWVKEGHDVVSSPDITDGVASGGDPVYAMGNEYDRAVFAELQGNPIKQIEIDGEARYDNYKTFGSDTTPKVGIKFTPWQWIAVRGTWSKGFRAPSVAEGVSSGETFGAGSYTDPVLCPNAVPQGKVVGPGDYQTTCELALEGVTLANQHLKDVTSTNFTTGLVLQPIRQANVSVDYYNIKINNDIIPAFEAGGFGANYISSVRGPTTTLLYCPTTFAGGCNESQLVPQQTPVGPIIYEAFPYINASSTNVSGYDLDLQYHWNWGNIGRFTGETTWTHELTYQVIVDGQTFELAGTHGPSGVSGDTGNPKDRFNVQLSWSKGPLTVTPSVNFISHFSITDSSSSIATCGEALGYFQRFPTTSTVPADEANFCTVKYFLETDVYASYQLSASLEVHASVTNLFNKQPPFDAQTYGSGSYFYPYDAAMHEDGAVGRFMMVGVTYNME